MPSLPPHKLPLSAHPEELFRNFRAPPARPAVPCPLVLNLVKSDISAPPRFDTWPEIITPYDQKKASNRSRPAQRDSANGSL